MERHQNRRRVQPIKWVKKGISAAAGGLGRVIRLGRKRRHAGHSSPLASMTAPVLMHASPRILVGMQADSSYENELSGPWKRTRHFPLILTNNCAGMGVSTNPVSNTPAATDDLSSQTTEHHISTRQHLLAVGTRLWGGGGWLSSSGICKVRIYDFAMYADIDAARRTFFNPHTPTPQPHLPALPAMHTMLQHLSPQPPAAPPTSTAPAGPEIISQRLLSHQDIPVSVILRTCRQLPMQSVLSEYEAVLRRRLQRAGQDPSDPALQTLLSQLSTSSATSNLAKGTVLRFERLPGGHLCASVDGVTVARVRSSGLCHAFFDTYFGEQPVSEGARAAAGQSLLQLLLQPGGGSWLRAGRGQSLRCGGPGVESCSLQLVE